MNIAAMPKNHFSQNLKKYRKLNHLTQQQLAEKLNVSHQTISFYEKGERECSINCLIKIADIFDISVDELVR